MNTGGHMNTDATQDAGLESALQAADEVTQQPLAVANREQAIHAARERIRDAEKRQREAAMDVERARLALAALTGDAREREWSEAYLATETGGPEAHERFMRLAARHKAKYVVSGERTIEDYSLEERPRIREALAEMAREEAQRAAEAPVVKTMHAIAAHFGLGKVSP